MKLLLISLIILYRMNSSMPERLLFNPVHILDSAKSIVTGVGSQVLQKIFSPKSLMRQSKQLLFGMPEVAVFQTINKLCSVYLKSGNIDPMVTPDINQMYFQLRTPCSRVSVPMTAATQLLAIPEFDVNKPVVLFITGWTSSIEANSITHMAKAFNCRGGFNFLALNASYFIDTLYTWSAFNCDSIGRIVAQGLVQLHRDVPAENIYLIGFSLGAHIAGYAGRYFEQFTGRKIQRITGLDPAFACFGRNGLTALQRGDANFVDVIHTNPGAFGERDTLGDIDFYVQGYAPIKPGCSALACSHNRAWRYYSESIYPGHEMDFLAIRCNSLEKMENGMCNGREAVMGLATASNSKGTYMINVNPQLPYGKNSRYNAGIMQSECGLCAY